MPTQGNVRNSLSATSFFFKPKTNGKSISKPKKRQRESQSLSHEALRIPINNFRCKGKIVLKLNRINGKKAR